MSRGKMQGVAASPVRTANFLEYDDLWKQFADNILPHHRRHFIVTDDMNNTHKHITRKWWHCCKMALDHLRKKKLQQQATEIMSTITGKRTRDDDRICTRPKTDHTFGGCRPINILQDTRRSGYEYVHLGTRLVELGYRGSGVPFARTQYADDDVTDAAATDGSYVDVD